MKEIRFPYYIQDPSVKAKYESQAADVYASRLLPVEGELPKTQEEITIIQNIDRAYRKYFDLLGISDYPGLPVALFHPVTDEEMLKKSERDTNPPSGLYEHGEKRIYYRHTPDQDPKRLTWVLTHEATHALSHEIDYASQKPNQKTPQTRREGYTLSGEKGQRLEYFNEGVTDTITHDVILTNLDIFPSWRQSADGEDYEGDYPYEQDIVNVVISGISEKCDLDLKQTWELFVKGFFTGKPDGLIAIRRTFGKHSLRILDCLVRSNESWEDQLKRNKPVALFLHSQVKNFRILLDEIRDQLPTA